MTGAETAIEVSPGIGAFIAFMVLAVAFVFLMLSMNRHMRKIQLRKAEDEARAELAREGEGGDDVPPVDPDGSPAGGDGPRATGPTATGPKD
ncbi:MULTISPECIES: hypothetical protein [unclassified Pseudactinotalea]|uniref:hypothetical protein n=1 Tax=unclassified Pseudactinotalea TaxID=2649176 RepID=UPI00128CFC16|nr:MULTISPECIES: hypothetical protein [unclassified Pseudactinotalea]MPV48726.1 hypothetical protein [Pseudactinotalea sp. HY160]QGH68716.1 hypothetical protein GCE65_03780 [Pseudactinotalea sp. HY158]